MQILACPNRADKDGDKDTTESSDDHSGDSLMSQHENLFLSEPRHWYQRKGEYEYQETVIISRLHPRKKPHKCRQGRWRIQQKKNISLIKWLKVVIVQMSIFVTCKEKIFIFNNHIYIIKFRKYCWKIFMLPFIIKMQI